ncbi:unnamed protein product [marine sediment metagenome]|uniref:Uncharacterized protein n=1 Tax=marine sediment metagenome TaxID=412755 RepID=X1S127_9ZZZZ
MIGYDNLAINHQILLDLPFREGVGAITHDVAKPHHQDVDLINAPTWESLVSGLGVIDLNGTNQYLQLLAAACEDLDFTAGDYSLGGWFFFRSGEADDKTPMSRFLLDNNGWELYHWTNEILTLRHHHAAGATLRTAGHSEGWAYDKWWFMGVSRSGASAQFYRGDIGGLVALPTTISDGGLINPEACVQNLYIGRDTTGVNLHNGKLWRPRAWGRALAEGDWMKIFDYESHWFGV